MSRIEEGLERTSNGVEHAQGGAHGRAHSADGLVDSPRCAANVVHYRIEAHYLKVGGIDS